MNVNALYAEIRWKTNKDATTFPDEDILLGLNLHTPQVIMDILRVVIDPDITGTEAKTNLISVTGLIAGQSGYNGEYAWPNDLVKPTRVEISYDGVNSYPATVYDLNENKSSEYLATAIAAEFSETNPMIRFDKGTYSIRPLPQTTIVGGIHIWYETKQGAFTLGTESPIFDSAYHEILAYMGAERWAEKHPEDYNSLWTTKKTEMRYNMLEFYKNKYKRDLVMRPKYENCK
jgi:hypothetical protein